MGRQGEERNEIGIDRGLIDQARVIAREMILSGKSDGSFTPDAQKIGEKPTFHIRENREELFVLISFEEGGHKFYLGSEK